MEFKVITRLADYVVEDTDGEYLLYIEIQDVLDSFGGSEFFCKMINAKIIFDEELKKKTFNILDKYASGLLLSRVFPPIQPPRIVIHKDHIVFYISIGINWRSTLWSCDMDFRCDGKLSTNFQPNDLEKPEKLARSFIEKIERYCEKELVENFEKELRDCNVLYKTSSQ
ncbi:MAG: hypothetical protein WCL23_00945 [Candidatus Moraniibacteriota bacterium]